VGGHAGRLADTLSQRLGPKNVFQDVTGIATGRDFVSAIQEALVRCDSALAVIGPGWLAASTPEGRPRLWQADDYVRLELATVLSRDIPVTPVLVGGAGLPAAGDLPEELRPLLRRQAFVLRDETWHRDVEGLLGSLRGDQNAASLNRRRTGLAVVIALLVMLVAIAWWRPWSRRPDNASSASSVASSCPDPSGPEWTLLPLADHATAEQQQDDGTQIFTVQAARWRGLEPGRWQIIVDVSMENRTQHGGTHSSWRYDSVVVGQREFPQSCFQAESEGVSSGTVGEGRTGYIVKCQPGGRVDLILGDSPRTRLRVTSVPESAAC